MNRISLRAGTSRVGWSVFQFGAWLEQFGCGKGGWPKWSYKSPDHQCRRRRTPCSVGGGCQLDVEMSQGHSVSQTASQFAKWCHDCSLIMVIWRDRDLVESPC